MSKIELPIPSGPHPVGVLDFELTDTEREELFAPGESRRIPARAWYPASHISGEPRPYATEKEFEHQVSRFCIDILQFEAEIPEVFKISTNAYENAPAADIGKCPTLVFSHGGFSFLQQNTVLMEHLASHGYLVVSISHPYVSMCSIMSDGSVVRFADEVLEAATSDVASKPELMEEYTSPDIARRYQCRLWSATEAAFAPHYIEWEQDALHAVERLATGKLPESAELLLPLIDKERLGTFGMSLGCSASAAAQFDERVKATVILDGGVFDPRLIDTDVPVPAMVLSSDMEYLAPGNTDIHLAEFNFEKLTEMGLRDDVLRFEVAGAAHIAFSDFALIPEDKKQASAVAGHHLGAIDGVTLVHIMNDFVKAFFDRYLLGTGSGLDEELLEKYPAVKPVDLSHVREWARAR